MRTLGARLGAALLGGLLLAGPGHACRKRLADILAGGGEFPPFVARILEVSRTLQTSFERGIYHKERKLEAARGALAEFRSLRREFPVRPEGIEIPGDEYPLVLETLAGYFDRLEPLLEEATFQKASGLAVEIQHILGELFGENPGSTGPLQALGFTLQTLQQLPPLGPASRREWEVRVELARKRFDRWRAGAQPPGVAEMRTVQALDERIRGLEDQLVANRALQGDAAPQPTRSRLQQEILHGRGGANRVLMRLQGQMVTLAWKPGALKAFLREEPPETPPLQPQD